MKKIFLIIFFLIIIIIFYSSKLSNKNNYILITTIPISDITEKTYYNKLFYLTIVLDDYIIEKYNLSYNELTLKSSERIYNKIIVNSGFSGASLRITITNNKSNNDLENILKERNTDYCEIIGVTKKDNTFID